MGQAADRGRQALGTHPASQLPPRPAEQSAGAAPVDQAADMARGLLDSVPLMDQVQRYPLPSVGLAIASGFVLGRFLGRQGGRQEDQHLASQTTRWSDPFWESSSAPRPGSVGYAHSSSSAADSPGVISTLQSGLSDSIRKGTGQAPNDLVSSITAALTGIFVDKAKELLDQNLPGFSERYDQAARAAGGHPDGGSMGQDTAGRGPINGGYQAQTSAIASQTGSTG